MLSAIAPTTTHHVAAVTRIDRCGVAAAALGALNVQMGVRAAEEVLRRLFVEDEFLRGGSEVTAGSIEPVRGAHFQ